MEGGAAQSLLDLMNADFSKEDVLYRVLVFVPYAQQVTCSTILSTIAVYVLLGNQLGGYLIAPDFFQVPTSSKIFFQQKTFYVIVIHQYMRVWLTLHAV